jgi:hypothetical protein
MNTTPKLGDIVCSPHNMWQRYGKIIRQKRTYRCSVMGEAILSTIKYIAPETGQLMRCPDDRCGGACVCCAETRWPDQIERWGKPEIDLLVNEGMLDRKLVTTDQCKEPRKRKRR